MYQSKSGARIEIYTTLFLRGLAIALVGVFVPAYLMSLGFSLRIALVFLAISYLAYLVFSPLAAEMAHRLGLKKTVIISPFITIGYIFALFGIKYYAWLLYPAAIIGGLSAMLFWIPINSHFAANTDHKHAGEESGYLHAISRLAAVVGPLAGGLLIVNYGFGLLYTISAGLLALCIIPLFMSRDYLVPLKRSWRAAFTLKNIQYMYLFFAQGIFAICAALVYPFYVYTQTSNFEVTGFVAAAMGVGTIFSAVFAGKLADRIGKHKTMRIAAIFSSLVWVAAMYFTSTVAFYVVSALIGLSTILLDVLVFAIFCNKIRRAKSRLAEHMVFREVGLSIGRMFIFVAMLIFVAYAFELAFILSAASAFYFAITRLI